MGRPSVLRSRRRATGDLLSAGLSTPTDPGVWILDPGRAPVAQDDGDAPLADAPAFFCVGDFELDEVGAHALGWRELDHTLHSLVLAPGQDKMTCLSLPPPPRQKSMLLRIFVATSMHMLGMNRIYSSS